MTKNVPTCPRCQSRRVVRIACGLPAPDTVEPFLAAIYNDAVIPGGSVIWDDSPEWHCHACGNEWSAAKTVAKAVARGS